MLNSAAMWVVVVALTVLVAGQSDDVCHCECCYQGGCCVLQGSFLVGRCANCTIALCEGLYPCPGESRMIKRAQCSDRNSPGKAVLFYVFCAVLGALVVFGCVKDCIPGLQQYNQRNFG